MLLKNFIEIQELLLREYLCYVFRAFVFIFFIYLCVNIFLLADLMKKLMLMPPLFAGVPCDGIPSRKSELSSASH